MYAIHQFYPSIIPVCTHKDCEFYEFQFQLLAYFHERFNRKIHLVLMISILTSIQVHTVCHKVYGSYTNKQFLKRFAPVLINIDITSFSAQNIIAYRLIDKDLQSLDKRLIVRNKLKWSDNVYRHSPTQPVSDLF